MREDEFRAWLLNWKNYDEATASSRICNCKKVEHCIGNIDVNYKNDMLESVIVMLTYSKNDERQGNKPKHNIKIDGNIYNGTATLKSAIRLYQEFSKQCFLGVPSIQSTPDQILRHRIKSTGAWPAWEAPTSDTVLKIAKLVTPFVRFLHPEVVKTIVADNEKNWEAWRNKLVSRGVDPEFYLWEKSSCAFPGVRRYMGSKEIAYYRKHIDHGECDVPDALKLDDNSFPKHIWSFIFRGKPFQNFGPLGYSLAHLADHKDYKNRRGEEFEFSGIAPDKVYGLYSCPSNTVYMPSNMIRLSDFNLEVRLLLLNKAKCMYGSVCNILPGEFQIKQIDNTDWHVDSFEWADPVGEGVNIDKFIEYRERMINEF